jgi:hypothetical protein
VDFLPAIATQLDSEVPPKFSYMSSQTYLSPGSYPSMALCKQILIALFVEQLAGINQSLFTMFGSAPQAKRLVTVYIMSPLAARWRTSGSSLGLGSGAAPWSSIGHNRTQYR